MLHRQLVWGDAVGEVDLADVLEEVFARVVTVAGQAADDLVDLVVDATDVAGVLHDFGDRGGKVEEFEDLFPVLGFGAG